MKKLARLFFFVVIAAFLLQVSSAGEGDPPVEIGDIGYRESYYLGGAWGPLPGVWRPGHAALFVGGALDGTMKFIESNTEGHGPYATRSIYEKTLNEFTSPHIDDRSVNDPSMDYLGAKTHNPVPTPTQRLEICSYAMAKLDLPISYYDGNGLNPKGGYNSPSQDYLASTGYVDEDEYSDDNIWSYDHYNEFWCVGFCERAYEIAGLDPTTDEADNWNFFLFTVPMQWTGENTQWATAIPPKVIAKTHLPSPGTNIVVGFEPDNFNAGTFNGNVTVVGSSSGFHFVSMTYAASTYQLTINPTIDFSIGETVTVTLTTGIKDLANNILDGDGDGIEGENHTFSFQILSPFTISPADSFTSSGLAGGLFTPVSKTYTLTNQGASSITWTATGKPTWLNLSSTGSTLPAGANYNLFATINSSANNLAAGTHTAKITISGAGTTSEIPVKLVVFAQPPAPENFSLIGSGSFQMGDQSNPLVGNSDRRELPVHSVYVSAFYMAKYEVTKELWDNVRAWGMLPGRGYDLAVGNGSYASKGANHPVHSITWHDMVKWCNARSEMENLVPCYYTDAARTAASIYKTGNVNIDNTMVKWNANGYRLPTEAEWEKAARGGLSGNNFPWGNTISHSQANFWNNGGEAYQSGTTGPHSTYAVGGYPFTSPVGSFAPQPTYGLYDMSGNVWEWCWDRYSGSYYSAPGAGNDPLGPDSGTYRVVRGGSWGPNAWTCRVAHRTFTSPSGNGFHFYMGFRPARSGIGGSGVQTPVAVSPGSATAPGSEVPNIIPALAWTSVTGAVGYGVSVRDVASGSVVYSNDGLAAVTSVTLPAGVLTGGGRYAWNVRARDNNGWGDFSPDRFFQTMLVALPAPFISLNADERTSTDLTSTTATIRWSWGGSLANSTGIVVTVVRDFDNSVIVNNQTISAGASSYSVTGLDPVTVYRINVAYQPVSGYTVGSTAFQFVTRLPAPTLVSPVGGSTVGGNVLLDWNGYNGLAMNYRVQISSSSSGFSSRTGFSSPVAELTTSSTTNSIWNGGAEGRTYWWTVRQASSGKPNSYYSSPQAFVVNTPDVALNDPVFTTPSGNITHNASTVTWSWNGNPANATGISVSVRRLSGDEPIVHAAELTADKTGYLATSLEPNTKYRINVAYNPQPGFTQGSTSWEWWTKPNTKPVIHSVETPVRLGDGRIQVSLNASDAENDPMTCRMWLLRSNGTQVTNSDVIKGTINSGYNIVYFSTAEIEAMSGLASGTYRVWLVVSDPLHNSTADVAQEFSPSFSYSIPNSPPSFTSDSTLLSGTEDTPFYGQLTATDSDAGDTLVFSRISGPGWLAVSSDGVLSGTPMNEDVGVNSFIVRVTDAAGEVDTATLSITVVNTNNRPLFTTNPITMYAAKDEAFSGTLSAMDVDMADVLFYTKLSGPGWLQVAGNGTLSGTPFAGELGLNYFSVRVTDSAGASDNTTLVVSVWDPTIPPRWTNPAGGSWPVTGNWLYQKLANGTGGFADFFTLDLGADCTITLDGARTIGGLRFGDTTPSHNWSLNTGNAGPLTLAATAGWPSIEVVNQTTTINTIIVGTQGFEKTGAGMLRLNGANTYIGDTAVSAGVLELGGSAIGDANKLILNGGRINLPGGVNETVGTLFVGTTQYTRGTWGSSMSAATHKDDTHFTGIGVLKVTNGPSDFDTWISGFTSIPSGERETASDPDRDGIPNAVEFVIGGNPAASLDPILLPTFEILNTDLGTGTGDYFLFTYRRTDASVGAGVSSGVEYDDDLSGPWTHAVDGPGGVRVVETNDFHGAGIDRVQVYIPRGANARMLGRMKVTVP